MWKRGIVLYLILYPQGPTHHRGHTTCMENDYQSDKPENTKGTAKSSSSSSTTTSTA